MLYSFIGQYISQYRVWFGLGLTTVNEGAYLTFKAIFRKA